MTSSSKKPQHSTDGPERTPLGTAASNRRRSHSWCTPRLPLPPLRIGHHGTVAVPPLGIVPNVYHSIPRRRSIARPPPPSPTTPLRHTGQEAAAPSRAAHRVTHAA